MFILFVNDFQSTSNDFFHDWGECPGPINLEYTLVVFADNSIENIIKKWILMGRCGSVTIVKLTSEFTESLLEKIKDMYNK